MSRKKRVSLTLEQKLHIIRTVEEGDLPKAQIARQFDVHRTAIAKIIKQKDAVIKASTWRSSKGRKTLKYVSSGISFLQSFS